MCRRNWKEAPPAGGFGKVRLQHRNTRVPACSPLLNISTAAVAHPDRPDARPGTPDQKRYRQSTADAEHREYAHDELAPVINKQSHTVIAAHTSLDQRLASKTVEC